MPDSSDIDEIMYQIHVIDKVRKGQEAISKYVGSEINKKVWDIE